MKEPIIKKALFLDDKGNTNYAVVRHIPDVAIMIDSFDEKDNTTGYMRLYFHPNNRLYLDVIYCYDDFRRRGIARKLSDLADYILKDYKDYIIRGNFSPSQLSTDRDNNIFTIEQDLNSRAQNFYISSGYSIVSYEEFIIEPDNFSDIDLDNDFRLGEDISKIIVVKKIAPKDNYNFSEINGLLVSDNALGLKIEESINEKSTSI